MHLGPREYNLLELHQKALLLDKCAAFIIHLNRSSIVYTLFAYSTYYIEVMVDSETNNLMNISAFGSGHSIDKYLEDISLDEILG